MVDKAIVKRWPDGRQVTVAQLTGTEARVRIGAESEYRILTIEAWRKLPFFCEEDQRAH